jgi:hypothetical protein
MAMMISPMLKALMPGQKKVTIVAITMPQPAQMMPPRAVTRRAHALQADDEQQGGDEVAGP